MTTEAVQALELRLHDVRVGYLAGYQSGRNVLVFDEGYRNRSNRPTLTLTAHPRFPRAEQVLQSPWIRQQRLHPLLSNLLPEGALKEWLATILKVHPDNEFPLLAQLGQDLPGALIAAPLPAVDIPDHLLAHRTSVIPVRRAVPRSHGFSLAGVQMKFSMREREGRFHFGHADEELGDWIIKTPSTRHRGVPANEFSMMQLATAAGAEPEWAQGLVSTCEMRLPSLGQGHRHTLAHHQCHIERHARTSTRSVATAPGGKPYGASASKNTQGPLAPACQRMANQQLARLPNPAHLMPNPCRWQSRHARTQTDAVTSLPAAKRCPSRLRVVTLPKSREAADWY